MRPLTVGGGHLCGFGEVIEPLIGGDKGVVDWDGGYRLGRSCELLLLLLLGYLDRSVG